MSHIERSRARELLVRPDSATPLEVAAMAAEIERLHERQIREPPFVEVLSWLRAEGWAVAVHNDYRLDGESFTFWLVVKGERALKGEGRTDREALDQILARLAQD